MNDVYIVQPDASIPLLNLNHFILNDWTTARRSLDNTQVIARVRPEFEELFSGQTITLAQAIALVNTPAWVPRTEFSTATIEDQLV